VVVGSDSAGGLTRKLSYRKEARDAPCVGLS